MTSLTLTSTEALIEELRSRYDALIFAGVRSTSHKNELFYSEYRGGLTVGIGLCERLKARLLETALSPSEAWEEGEEE